MSDFAQTPGRFDIYATFQQFLQDDEVRMSVLGPRSVAERTFMARYRLH